MLDKLQDCKSNLKHKLCSFSKHVVPNSNTQPEWETVEEASLKPLVDPQQIWYIFIFKMSIKLGKLFFENNFENVDEFDQQRKFVGVETGQSSVSGLVKICSV